MPTVFSATALPVPDLAAGRSISSSILAPPQSASPDLTPIKFNLDHVRRELPATSTIRTKVALQSIAKCCTNARSLGLLVRNRGRDDKLLQLSTDCGCWDRPLR